MAVKSLNLIDKITGQSPFNAGIRMHTMA